MNLEEDKDPPIHIGLLAIHSPHTDVAPLKAFALRMTDYAERELETASKISWIFHWEEPIRLANDDDRFASDFLDQASFRKAQGPYDAMVVVTDVPLISRDENLAPGLASSTTRVVIISSRSFVLSPRDEPIRELDDPSVVANSQTLLLHLFGHLLHLSHTADDPLMSTYRFDAERTKAATFSASARDKIRKEALRFPDAIEVEGGWLQLLLFHLKAVFRNPQEVLLPLWRNQAPLIPLKLPRLATAALAPSIILIFGAEIWDVALHMSDNTAWFTALGTIIISSWYMMVSLKLAFPRKERQVVTEHAAVVNVTVFLTLLFTMIGLFGLMLLFMLGIEFFIFPPDLMRQWPSLDNPTVTFNDKLRLAVFISTLGVLTGALAGGFESKRVIREFALFRKDA